MGRLSLALSIALASGLLALLGASVAPAVEQRGTKLENFDVRVNLSGTETADYTRREVDDDDCFSRTTETAHISQQTSFQSTRTKVAYVFSRGSPISKITAAMTGRVNVNRQADGEYEVAHGSCSDTPGLVERGPNPNIETSDCGARTLKQDLELYSASPFNPRSLFAIGWAPDDRAYPDCGYAIYEISEVDPLPAIGPPSVDRKLTALRAGRRKQVEFEYQDTITLHSEQDPPGTPDTLTEDTVVDLRWTAKVTRK